MSDILKYAFLEQVNRPINIIKFSHDICKKGYSKRF